MGLWLAIFFCEQLTHTKKPIVLHLFQLQIYFIHLGQNPNEKANLLKSKWKAHKGKNWSLHTVIAFKIRWRIWHRWCGTWNNERYVRRILIAHACASECTIKTFRKHVQWKWKQVKENVCALVYQLTRFAELKLKFPYDDFLSFLYLLM